MPSPAAGRSPAQQALAAARALTAYTASGLDSVVAVEAAVAEIQARGERTTGRWIHVVGDEAARYVRVGATGAGESSARLPDGEAAALEIDVRGRRPVSDWLRSRVLALEQSAAAARVAGVPAEVIDGLTEVVLARRLRGALATCAPEYHQANMRDLRAALLLRLETTNVDGRNVPLLGPEAVATFSRHCADLRAADAADAVLVGSVAAVAQLCQGLAANAGPIDPRRLVGGVLHHLLSGEVAHPVTLLGAVVHDMIGFGLTDPLMQLADMYREKVETAVTQASTRATLDDFLAELYVAVPRAHAAHIMYAQLVRDGERLTPEQRTRAEAVLRDVDELLARLPMPFAEQVMDADGARWQRYIRRLAAIRRANGMTAARNAVRDLERLLVFPTPIIDELLREAVAEG